MSKSEAVSNTSPSYAAHGVKADLFQAVLCSQYAEERFFFREPVNGYVFEVIAQT